jgi:hypothetical protein
MPEDGQHDWNVEYSDKSTKYLWWLMAVHTSVLI